MATEKSAQRLHENKCPPHLQERQLGGLRKVQASQPHFIPRKFMEQLFLENIARHIKEEKIM